jgi:hypothetical protein
MAHNASFSDVFTTAVEVPDDGDGHTAISLETPIVGVGNRTLWNNNRLVEAGGGNLAFAPGAPTYNLNTRFTFDVAPTGVLGTWIMSNTAAGDGGDLWFPMPALHNCTITGLNAWVHGDVAGIGHPGFGFTLPRIGVVRVNEEDATSGQIGWANDPSAALGAYEVAHEISFAFAASPYNSKATYWARIQGEYGAQATNNCFAILRLYVTVVAA